MDSFYVIHLKTIDRIIESICLCLLIIRPNGPYAHTHTYRVIDREDIFIYNGSRFFFSLFTNDWIHCLSLVVVVLNVKCQKEEKEEALTFMLQILFV